jgi:hypothetical protein
MRSYKNHEKEESLVGCGWGDVMWCRVLLAGVLLGGIVGACAIIDPVDSRYDTISRSLAKSRNEAILLNLIRASHDDPLSFTTIANVTPALTNTSSFALPSFMFGPRIPLTAAAAATSAAPLFSPGRDVIFGNTTAGNTTAISTNFNVSTQETYAFYDGFLKPIDLQVLNYFVRQGYQRELLFWLFTDAAEIKIDDHRYGFRYDPPNDFGCFEKNVPTLLKDVCFSDLVRVATVSGLTVEAQTQQKSSTGGKPATTVYTQFCFNQVQQQRAERAMRLPERIPPKDIPPEDIPAWETLKKLHSSPLLYMTHKPTCGEAWKVQSEPQSDTFSFPRDPHAHVTFTITPRSAYGVFIFLGSVMKWEWERMKWESGQIEQLGYGRRCYYPGVPENTHVPCDRKDVTEPPTLWTVRDGRTMMAEELIKVVHNGAGHCFAQTLFRDGDYCVPDDATTTKRIFGLLAQLIAIQTQASDLSITPVVRIIQ